MSKYKYYFKQPRSEIVKDVFKWLAVAGAVYIAASSPYFIRNLMRSFKYSKKYDKKKIYDTFYNLERNGYIKTRVHKHQTYISLTEKGKKKAGWMQIDSLKIKKPKKWDKKWRIVIFDIVELKRNNREAFRGKLKELGFQPLQKSVWVCPFSCRDEITLLRDFFGLTEKDIKIILANKIENDKELKKIFRLT